MSARPPHLAARKPLLLGLVTLILLVAGFGGWSVGVRISGALIAPGRLEVERNRQVIQHPEGGLVAAVRIAEGDRVAGGDVLIELDGTELRAELALTEARLHDALARRARLEAERDDADRLAVPAGLAARGGPDLAQLIAGQRRLFQARRAALARARAQLEEQRRGIEDQIAGLAVQRAAAERQLQLLDRDLASQQSLLDRGLAQAPRVLALRRERARLEGILGDLDARAGQAASRRAEIALERDRLGADRREAAITALGGLDPQVQELEDRRRRLADRIARLTLRAPGPGVVHGLRVFAPAAVVRPAEPMLYLIPQDRPLVVAVHLPASGIAQVRPGQRVDLRNAAFGRDTPALTGHVSRISADTFTEAGNRDSFYRVEVELASGSDPPDALLPGMPVEAFFATAPRRPLDYMLDPLARYLRRTFREG